jgi:hypothetical protein
MNLVPIIDRIKTLCPAFKVVGGVAEFDANLTAPPATPACYVVPQGETADQVQGMKFALQTVQVDFGVFFCLRNARDSNGQASFDDLESLRQSVREAIYGWQPVGATALIRATGSQLFDFQPGLMWWQDGYQTAHHIRSTD